MQIPFNIDKLDRLLEAEGIDFLLINDKSTAQYLLGGYKFFFFAQKMQLVLADTFPHLDIPNISQKMPFILAICLRLNSSR